MAGDPGHINNGIKENSLDIKLEENKKEEHIVYIGIDPDLLLKSFDIEKIFGAGCFTVPKIELEEENLLSDNSQEFLSENGNEEIACKMCEYKSVSQHHFKRHMSRVHEKSIQCDQCSFTCGSIDYLRDHIKAVHEGTKLKCKKCPAEFNWRSDLSRHMKGVHSGIVYTCLVCSLELSSDKSLKRHMSKSKCRLSLPPGFSVGDLENYIKTGLPGANKEGDSDKKEETFETLEKRIIQTPEKVEPPSEETDLMQKDNGISAEKDNASPITYDISDSVSSMGVKLHKCPSCEKTFNKMYNLKVHINSIHTKSKLEHCPHCDYTSPVKDSMKQHILTTHNGEKYPCTQCDKVFRWKSDATRHMKNAHSNETYTCPDCDKVFSQERNMKEHIRNKCCTKSKEVKNRKVVEEDLICSYCGYTTADKRTLERHIKGVHLKEGLTKCEECDYSSIRPDDVRRHFEHKHVGKQYICEICSKICKWKTEFNHHMRVHQGVEFLCDICDFRTVYKSGLSRHKKSVHEGLKFECEHCNQCYTQISSLRTHQKLKHSDLIIK